jgi:hypothetical protein
MDNLEAMRLAGKLAEPFDASTFAAISGQSEAEAANMLSNLQAMSWLESEYSSTVNGPVYRLSASSRQGLASGSFGY